MDQAGFLSFPVEVLHCISGYLSVEDVLSCSLTCHYLRYALNNNMVWKRYLPEQDISMLELLEQHVQPVFQINGLTPLCENRVHFMRRTHLLQNWKEENFVELCSTELSSTKSYSYRTKHIVFKDDYLYLLHTKHSSNLRDRSFIEVWDITDDPVLFTSITLDENICRVESLHVIGTYLVVNGSFRLDVYLINIPENIFPLAHSIELPEGEGFWGFGRLCYTHYVIDHYLVVSLNTTSKFEVWDIYNGSKIGSFESPAGRNTLYFCFLENNNWLLQYSPGDFTCYLNFNIEKRLFSESVLKIDSSSVSFIFKYNSYVVLYKHVGRMQMTRCFLDMDDVIVKEDIECTVYDFNNSTEVSRRRFNNVVQPCFPTGNGTFVLLSDHHFKIIDVMTLETIVNFEAGHQVFYVEKQLNVFGSVFVVTCDNKFLYELWDIQKNTKVSSDISKGDYKCHVFLNELCTKMVLVCNKKIRVLHFW